MAEDPNIDFERAATLMDVVQKVATIAPAYMSLSSMAMGELKEMNQVAQDYLNELGRERLAEEQEAQARLRAEHNEANTTTPKIYVPEEETEPDDSAVVARRV